MARGGKREGAGRPAGSPNKATADIKAIAREYTDEAMLALVNVIRSTESDAARVSAIKELFDRGFGKATTMIEGSLDVDATIRRIERSIVDPQN